MDAQQVAVALPHPMPRLSMMPPMHAPLPYMPLAGAKFPPLLARPTLPLFPHPFAGMPPAWGMVPHMGLPLMAGMDLGSLLGKPGKPAGSGRRRKRKRGLDRDASARCPVCVDQVCGVFLVGDLCAFLCLV